MVIQRFVYLEHEHGKVLRNGNGKDKNWNCGIAGEVYSHMGMDDVNQIIDVK